MDEWMDRETDGTTLIQGQGLGHYNIRNTVWPSHTVSPYTVITHITGNSRPSLVWTRNWKKAIQKD